jgi:tellurite resistance protein TerC
METIGTWWMWAGFFADVLVMLAVDLFWSAAASSTVYRFRRGGDLVGHLGRRIAALCRNALVVSGWQRSVERLPTQKTLKFVTGYLIEKSLAVDNVFVWLMLFSFFAIPLELQKRVLVLGVLGAIVMRTVMIFAGVWLIASSTGCSMSSAPSCWSPASRCGGLPTRSRISPTTRSSAGSAHMKVTDELHGERFFVLREEAGKLCAMPRRCSSCWSWSSYPT